MSPSDPNAPTAPALTSRRSPPELLLVGTDYRNAPLDLRERVRFSETAAEEMLVHLLARPEIAEAYLLSTCNRTEVLVRPRDGEAAHRTVIELVFHPRAPQLVDEGRLYIRRDAEAAKHLFAVASGLESMVLGEPEILGQVRQATALAAAVGAQGETLGTLLRTAVGTGARARRETGIAAGAVSLGYSVVELTRTIFTEPGGVRALILGAGETAHLVARALRERGVQDLMVANRNPERTAQFLNAFPGAEGIPFDRRRPALGDSDLVIATTGAPEPILLFDDFRDALRRRRGRPLLAVDLGVPRNIDPEARRMENLFLQDIDSLQNLIRRNLRQRREEAPRVQEIIDRELERYYLSFQRREAEPIVASLQRQAEAIRCKELELAAARFPPELHDDLDRLTRALVRKILHHPSHRLRSGGEEHDRRLDLVRELFQLEPEGGDDGPA